MPSTPLSPNQLQNKPKNPTQFIRSFHPCHVTPQQPKLSPKEFQIATGSPIASSPNIPLSTSVSNIPINFWPPVTPSTPALIPFSASTPLSPDSKLHDGTHKCAFLSPHPYLILHRPPTSPSANQFSREVKGGLDIAAASTRQ